MPGREARTGFWFQDAKALTQLLDDALERRRRRLLDIALEPELRVRLESAVEVVADDSETDDDEPLPPRPSWDGIFCRGEEVIVDECKLHDPKRDDRVTFYHRLRGTVSGGGISLDRITPRFTVGADRIQDPDRWHALGGEVQCTAVPTTPPTRVNNVAQLAAEALYYLTTPSPVWTLRRRRDRPAAERAVAWTRALTLHEARSLLSRFRLDASESLDQVEVRLHAQLAAIDAGKLQSDELVDLLGGFINRIARGDAWTSDLTADVLTDKLQLAARFLSTPVAVEELWHRLHRTAPELPASKVAPQRWDEVQPTAATVVRDREGWNRVVFTSEGGVGKSFLLTSLHAEHANTRAWVDAVAPLQHVEEALALGAWATQRTGGDLTVFIDALDQVPDAAALLASVHRAVAVCERAVVYAAVRFARWVEVRDHVSAWKPVRLERWGHDRVRALVHADRAESLSADLIDLLRTPLLLDLFLRTFPAGETVPVGLATRHGVLREYFERRVTPHDCADAGARRDVLDAGVAAVLANRVEWRDTTEAAKQLTSEGVVTRVYGELRFRHALLRDFSAVLRLVSQSAEEIATALRGVASPIVRNELLRAIIEARLDPDFPLAGPPITNLIRVCADRGLAPGIALGTTDAPTAALLAATAPLEGGAVLRQALEHAKLMENRAWLRVPTALGVARPAWFETQQLRGLANLAELAVSTGDAASTELARTLRAWTRNHSVGDETPWPISKIGQLLVQTLVDTETVAWYESLDLRAAVSLSSFYEQLRDLSANAHLDEESLHRALHKLVFCAGDRVLHGQSLWEATNLCLDDHRKARGLLTARPALGLRILFALSVASEEEDQRRRDAAFAELSSDWPQVEEQGPETRLRRLPELSEREAIGDLVADAPATAHSPLDEIERLKDEVEERATSEIAFAETLAHVALSSRSLHSRLMVLGLSGSEAVAAARHEILRDRRIYHCHTATDLLWDAIHTEWPALAADIRARVQENILSIAQSRCLYVGCVGQLATAISIEDRVPDLAPYIAYIEETGQMTRPRRRYRIEVTRGPIDDDEREVPAGTPEQIAAQWRRLHELVGANVNDEAAATEALTVFRDLLESGAVDDAPEWGWFAIARLIDRDRRRAAPCLVAVETETLFAVAMQLAPRDDRRANADAWATVIDIADACTSYVADDRASAMRADLMAEVSAAAGENAEQADHASQAITVVGAATWFDEGSGGRAVLEHWFRDCLHGEALGDGLRFLQFFDGEPRLALLRHVLETPGRIQQAEAAVFIDAATRHIASWAIWWEPEIARELVRSWCEAETRPGALAHLVTWCTFLDRFAWCLQDALRRAESAAAARRFIPLLSLTWCARLRIADDPSDGNFSVGWAIAAPLSNGFPTVTTPAEGSWSISLRPMLVSVIADGGRGDVGALQQVDWVSLDPETLRAAARATIERALRENAGRPAGDWMIDDLVRILAQIGQVPELPIEETNRVLDALHRLGQTAPLANQLAPVIAARLREAR